jgi:hypothetical protein
MTKHAVANTYICHIITPARALFATFANLHVSSTQLISATITLPARANGNYIAAAFTSAQKRIESEWRRLQLSKARALPDWLEPAAQKTARALVAAPSVSQS